MAWTDHYKDDRPFMQSGTGFTDPPTAAAAPVSTARHRLAAPFRVSVKSVHRGLHYNDALLGTDILLSFLWSTAVGNGSAQSDVWHSGRTRYPPAIANFATAMVLLFRAHVDAIFRFRSFVVGSVRRDFATRYRNSILGAAWLLLQPLSQIIVFTVIFSQVMRARLEGSDGPLAYSIHLCAGMLTWMLFAEITGRSTTVFIDHANLIKKLNFQRICLPVIVVINACIAFAIIFAIFTVFLLLTGNFPGWRFFLLLPVLAVEVLFAIGLGILLGVLNVFFRDVGQLFSIALQFWFWLTPIVYPVESLPDWAAQIVIWNPMAVLVTAFQAVLVYSRSPDWRSVAAVGVGSIILCGGALRLFQRRAGEMVDEL